MPIIDGVGSTHQCRDPSLLWDIVSKAGSVKSPLHAHDVRRGDTISSMLRKIDEAADGSPFR